MVCFLFFKLGLKNAPGSSRINYCNRIATLLKKDSDTGRTEADIETSKQVFSCEI